MITNGRIQLWPFLRVALFLVVGVLIGDALDCRVRSSVWMWTYVVLLSAFVASYFFLRKHPIFQTVVLFIMVVAGGLWRTTCFLEDYNVSFSDAPETFEAVVETQPVEKERSVKCQPSFLKKTISMKTMARAWMHVSLSSAMVLWYVRAWKRRSGRGERLIKDVTVTSITGVG